MVFDLLILLIIHVQRILIFLIDSFEHV